jgi:hypothetical protein
MILSRFSIFIRLGTSGILLAALFSPLGTVFAKEHLSTNLKEVIEKVTEISTIAGDETLTDSEKEQKELAARKEALVKIFELTLLEDQDLKARLSKLEGLKPEYEEMRKLLLNVFTENENAYRVMNKRLNEATTIEDVKQLATDFKNWRNAVYNPKVEQILSFVLVFQQEKTLTIARERFQKIQADLDKLATAKRIKKEDVDGLLQKSLLHLSIAEELHARAQRTVITSVRQELIVADKETKDLLLLPQTTGETEEKQPTTKELIAKSIEQIKLTYKDFIAIGKVVREKMSKEK